MIHAVSRTHCNGGGQGLSEASPEHVNHWRLSPRAEGNEPTYPPPTHTLTSPERDAMMSDRFCQPRFGRPSTKLDYRSVTHGWAREIKTPGRVISTTLSGAFQERSGITVTTV